MSLAPLHIDSVLGGQRSFHQAYLDVGGQESDGRETAAHVRLWGKLASLDRLFDPPALPPTPPKQGGVLTAGNDSHQPDPSL